MDRHKLTVLMPVYNEAQYLRASIQSILDQTYDDFEFLILNDASSDNSEEVIRSFKDKRIKYIKTERMKLSALLNYGVKIASGNIIARMDSDDIALPTRLEKQMEFIKGKDKNFISSAWFATFKKKKLINIVTHPAEDEDIKRQLNTSNPICHPLAVFHKDFFEEFGGYDEDLECLEDHDLWLRLRTKAEFGNIPEILLLKREKTNSLGELERSLPKDFVFGMLYSSFDEGYYDTREEAKKDKLKLEYYYGDQYNLRRRIYTYKFFPFKAFRFYLLSFLPTKLFRKKLGVWFKWKMNQISVLFSPKRKTLKNYLKKFA